MIYSYDERKIGNAFGEDLYQQSFLINTTTDLTEDSEYTLPNYVKNIYNLSCIISDGTIEDAMTAGRISSMLNYYASAANRMGITCTDYYNDGEYEASALLTFKIGSNPEVSPYAIVTIQYTKRATD